jgi:hypothetical protein
VWDKAYLEGIRKLLNLETVETLARIGGPGFFYMRYHESGCPKKRGAADFVGGAGRASLGQPVTYQFEILRARSHSQTPIAIMLQRIKLIPIIFSIVGLGCSLSDRKKRTHT